MYATASGMEDDRPRPGDRVKLCGNHRFAGSLATYLTDRATPAGGSRPIVRIEETGDESVVMDPENQMRKV